MAFSGDPIEIDAFEIASPADPRAGGAHDDDEVLQGGRPGRLSAAASQRLMRALVAFVLAVVAVSYFGATAQSPIAGPPAPAPLTGPSIETPGLVHIDGPTAAVRAALRDQLPQLTTIAETRMIAVASGGVSAAVIIASDRDGQDKVEIDITRDKADSTGSSAESSAESDSINASIKQAAQSPPNWSVSITLTHSSEMPPSADQLFALADDPRLTE